MQRPEVTWTNEQNEQPIGVHLDGTNVNFKRQSPVIQEGRTLIPVRGVCEQAGFEVFWFKENQQVQILNQGTEVVLQINNLNFTRNGENQTLDVPTQIIGGRTLIPIRAVAESLQMEVEWVASEGLVALTTSRNQQPFQHLQPPSENQEEINVTFNGEATTMEITEDGYAFHPFTHFTGEEMIAHIPSVIASSAEGWAFALDNPVVKNIQPMYIVGLRNGPNHFTEEGLFISLVLVVWDEVELQNVDHNQV